jgi:uncharacterized CHY-type Zn-finger protein
MEITYFDFKGADKAVRCGYCKEWREMVVTIDSKVRICLKCVSPFIKDVKTAAFQLRGKV